MKRVYRDTVASLYDGVTRAELSQAAILAVRARIEQQPEYSQPAARLLLDRLYSEALGLVAVDAAHRPVPVGSDTPPE